MSSDVPCTTKQNVNVDLFRDCYTICNCGEHIKSLRHGKEMKIRIDAGGKAKEVNLSVNAGEIKKKFKIHYLMAKTYIGGYDEEQHDISHMDGDKGNNHLQNIRILPKNTVVIPCDMHDIFLPGYPSLSKKYKVCRCGEHILSVESNNLLSQYKRKTGYKEVKLVDRVNNINKSILVHQIVANTFLRRNSDEETIIDHINRVRDDNRLENLRFASYSTNNSNTEPHSKSKPITQMDLNGNTVKEYNSIQQIIEDNPTFSSAGICICLKNDPMTRTSYNYRWKYKNESDRNFVYTPIEGEIFKPIINIEYYNSVSKTLETLDYPNYKVSNYGHVMGERNVLLGFDNGIANSVILPKNDKCKKRSMNIHVLVACMFLEKPPNYNSSEGWLPKFKDDDHYNCRADNLEWISFRDRSIETSGKKIIAQEIKEGCLGDPIKFASLSKASDYMFEKKGPNSKTTKSIFQSGIKACIYGYQESSYGYKWKLDKEE